MHIRSIYPGLWSFGTFNVADLNPYLKDEHLDNFRVNSSQQGEDDGGPSMSMSISSQGSPRESNFVSKIQEISFACQDTFQPSHSSKPVHKSDFVYVIF